MPNKQPKQQPAKQGELFGKKLYLSPLLWGSVGILVVLYAAFLWFPPLVQPSYSVVNPAPFLEQTSDLININEAGLEELMLLPNIGETRAQAVIDYRQQHGEFHTPDDLLQVPGIGPKTVEALKELICF